MEMKNKRGLIAVLDALTAYTIAFIAIGSLVGLMMLDNSCSTCEGRASYALNVWAEDLADAIGESSDWTGGFDPGVEDSLRFSLNNISKGKYLEIEVEGIMGDYTADYYGIEPKEVATAKRFVWDSGTVREFTVKVGI
jgi:hypothetical protein